MKTYEQLLLDLAKSESSRRYDIVNELGYLGKYQMGEAALIDCGYYKQDGKISNSFSDKFWTGKDGVKSKQNFLDNPQAQENAIREYMKIQWGYILVHGLDRYIGKTKKGILITESGLLGGAHLGGHIGVSDFIKKGLDAIDRNKVPVSHYVKKFSGYDTPFKSRKKLTGVQKDKKGTVLRYQIDGKEWVSKATAIQMAKDLELDGVVVNNRKGTVFLRTPPDQTTDINLMG
jgi:hypothetical protein